MAGKICNACGRLPGDSGPLINQSQHAYYLRHIIMQCNNYYGSDTFKNACFHGRRVKFFRENEDLPGISRTENLRGKHKIVLKHCHKKLWHQTKLTAMLMLYICIFLFFFFFLNKHTSRFNKYFKAPSAN